MNKFESKHFPTKYVQIKDCCLKVDRIFQLCLILGPYLNGINPFLQKILVFHPNCILSTGCFRRPGMSRSLVCSCLVEIQSLEMYKTKTFFVK